MTRRAHAISVFLVMLLVIAACAVSFAHAANVAIDSCGSERGWALAKVDPSGPGKATPDIPAIPVGSVDLSESPLRWAGVESPTPASWHLVLVQPLAPRAPPLA